MKKLFFAFLMSSLTLLGVSCQKENDFVEEGTYVTFTAFAEDQPNTKATLEKDGEALKFIWQTGDEIRLFCTKNDDKQTPYSYEATLGAIADDGTSATFISKSDITGYTLNYAAFSSDLSGGNTDTYVKYLPEISNYVSGTLHTPLLAVPSSPYVISSVTKHNELYFNHVGGALKFTLTNVPAGVNSVVFTAVDNINGKYSINVDGLTEEGVKNGLWIKGGPSDATNSVTFNFDALATAQDMIFYVPMPAGITLTGSLTIDVNTPSGSYDQIKKTFKENTSYTVGRAKVANIGTFAVTGTVDATPVATYKKVTSMPKDDWSGQYLIVCEDANVALNGSLESSSAIGGKTKDKLVSITTDDTINIYDDDNFYVTIAVSGTGYSIKTASGYYIGISEKKAGMLVANAFDSNLHLNTISSSAVIKGVSDYILCYNQTNNSIGFRYYSSQSSYGVISLYKKVETVQQ